MAKKKAKFPKRIAGVKVPKPLRRAGRPLARFAATPLGRAVIAEALVATAGALILNPDLRRRVFGAGVKAGLTSAAAIERAMAAVAAPLQQAKADLAAAPSEINAAKGIQGRGKRDQARTDQAAVEQPA